MIKSEKEWEGNFSKWERLKVKECVPIFSLIYVAPERIFLSSSRSNPHPSPWRLKDNQRLSIASRGTRKKRTKMKWVEVKKKE